MHPISQEAKKELKEALAKKMPILGLGEYAIEAALSIVESFPTSSEGLGTSTLVYLKDVEEALFQQYGKRFKIKGIKRFNP